MNENEKWINDEGRASCPACKGFGYFEDGTDDGIGCDVCRGDGVATKERAQAYIDGNLDSVGA